MNTSLSLHSTAVQHARKPIGANVSQSVKSSQTLGRAALLLQAIIYQIRLHASPLQFKSMRIEGSSLCLYGFQPDELDAQRLLKPFPAPSDGDQSLFEAALVHIGVHGGYDVPLELY
jgi:hypothetical protein